MSQACATCNHDRDDHPNDGPCIECHCAEFALEHPQGKPPYSERYNPDTEFAAPMSPAEEQAMAERDKQNPDDQSADNDAEDVSAADTSAGEKTDPTYTDEDLDEDDEDDES